MGLIPGVLNGGALLEGPAADGSASQVIVTNGSGKLVFRPVTVDASGNLTASGRVLVPSGTRFSPSYSFSTQGATGMFVNISPFYLGFAVTETETLKLSTTEATVTGNLTASGHGRFATHAIVGQGSDAYWGINGTPATGQIHANSISLGWSPNPWVGTGVLLSGVHDSVLTNGTGYLSFKMGNGNYTAGFAILDSSWNKALSVGQHAGYGIIGRVGVGNVGNTNTDYVGALTVKNTYGATVPGIVIVGHASQSGNAIDYQNSAGTSLFSVSSAGNLTASGRIESTAAGTSNSQGKFGSFELQSYAVNNAWLGENVYYSGSGSDFTYRANGYGVVIRSISGEVQIETCPSGTAGAAATPTIRAKFGQSGAFGIGGAISSGSGTYSGAAIVGDSSKNLTFAANATVVGTIYVGSTANEIWAQYGYLNLRNTGGNGVMIQDGSGVGRVVLSGTNLTLTTNTIHHGYLRFGSSGDVQAERTSTKAVTWTDGAGGNVAFNIWGTLATTGAVTVGTDLSVAESLTFTEVNNGNSGTSKTIAWGNGNHQFLTLTGNVTLAFTDPPASGRFTLVITQDATGGRTVTWPASVKWPGGAAPTISTGANAVDIVTLVFRGTTYYASISQNFS